MSLAWPGPEPTDGGDGELLLLALRARRDAAQQSRLRELLDRRGLDPALTLARRNKVDAAASVGFAAALGDDTPASLRGALAANERRVQALVDALSEAAPDLEAAECRPTVVEAGGVLLATDLPLAAFGSGDLDVLVARDRFDAALAALARHGFHPRKPPPPGEARAELIRETLRLEVRAEPFERRWAAPPCNDRSAVWLARRVPTPRAPRLHVLRPEDALALVAMHTALHTWLRPPGLRLHLDVDRLARDLPIDWPAAQAEIQALGAATRCWASLVLARDLLGAPVPAPVLDALSPPPARARALMRALARAGLLADGRPKLPGWRALALDALADDRSPLSWAAALALPDEAWLRLRFDRPDAPAPRWRLHLRRLGALRRPQ